MKVKKLKLYCKYCKHFHTAHVGQNCSRKCKVKNNYVDITDDACTDFKLAPIIYCNRDDNWIHLQVCLDRVEKRKCKKSKKCNTYKIIKEVAKNV